MYNSDKELHQAIGRKVKSLRLHNRLTIEQLGRRSGVSKSMVSMVEAGQRAPSIRSLVRIAETMNVTIGEILEDLEKEDSAIVTPRVEQKTEELSSEVAKGSVYHLVEMDWRNLFIRLYEYHLEDFPDPPAVFQHPGFWFVSVQSGTIEFEVNGATHRLSEGDAIACDADAPHSMSRVISGPVRMIGLQAWAHDHRLL